MITAETLQSCEKENLPDLVPVLEPADIEQLVAWLIEQDDNFRYKCFLLLQGRSGKYPDVYPYWDIFVEKLDSPNSYQRSLGLMLIAENARWDQAGKLDAILDRYLSFCDDEKPVTVRQCVQSLEKVVPYKSACLPAIVDKLVAIDLMERKETQRKILLLDILRVLATIRKLQPDERIDAFIQNALTGSLLDSKSKKMVAAIYAAPKHPYLFSPYSHY
jgi:hypothetical protein